MTNQVDKDIQFELNNAIEFGDYERAERIQRIKDEIKSLRSVIDNAVNTCPRNPYPGWEEEQYETGGC